jgi:hypothetical protein
MSYQGARARSEADETRRVFTVSKVRLNDVGSVIDVLWAEINAKSNLDIGESVVVPVADVIDAIHDGAQVSAVFPARFGALPDYAFEVIEFTNGLETIQLVGSLGAGEESRVDLNDLPRLDARRR